MAGKATVDGVLVAEAEVMCKLEDKARPSLDAGSSDSDCRCRGPCSMPTRGDRSVLRDRG